MMAIMKIKLIAPKKHLFLLDAVRCLFLGKAFSKLIYANEINVNIFHSAIRLNEREGKFDLTIHKHIQQVAAELFIY